MTDLFTNAPWMLAVVALLCVVPVLHLARLRAAGQARTSWAVLVIAGLLLIGLAACDPTAEPAPIITVVVTPVAQAVTEAPAPTVRPTHMPQPTVAAPTPAPEGDAAGSIDFVIPNSRLWEKTADNAYAISGEEDTFAWSKRYVKGNFEFSADVESDFGNYGEAMVVVYGDGKGWSPGCLIFNVTGYWQGIRAHTIYDPDVEWLVENPEELDFANRSRYRMTIRVADGEASLLVDDRLVASTPMFPQFNREGYIALMKYSGSAPVTFSNISFTTGDAGEAIAAAPTKAPTKTPAPTDTPAPTNTPGPTNTPAPPTNTPTPKPTKPPTNTPPPPFRPPTGILEDHAPGGQGELNIKNGTDADALVILTGLDDKAVKSGYIRNGESFNMTGIQDGTYRLYYSKGEAFNQETNRFTKNATYQRLDATIPYTTSSTQYTIWEVTLYGVVGGTVGSEQVDPSKFP